MKWILRCNENFHEIVETSLLRQQFSESTNVHVLLVLTTRYLGQKGHPSVVFVDGSYLQVDTEQDCIRNINATVDILSHVRVYNTRK